MGDIKYDRKLAIKTTGIKEWDDDNIYYNRCEPTPYKALVQLFKHYKLAKTDRLVDFGSGKGRVAFYIHHRFQIPVLGIEAQEDVINQARQNKSRYMEKLKSKDLPIHFEHAYAEYYQVKPEDNKFFFFNPFSADVFQEVLLNITDSLKSTNRQVDIILFYPTQTYRKVMKHNTAFVKYKEIIVPKSEDRGDMFIIYRHHA